MARKHRDLCFLAIAGIAFLIGLKLFSLALCAGQVCY